MQPIIVSVPELATEGISCSFILDIISDDPVTTEISLGSLPPGLTLSDYIDNNNPVITGTPTTPGSYDFTVTARADGSVSRDVTMIITEALDFFEYI